MIVIFGGTGTLGHALSEVIRESGGKHVAIVSRCELRQKEMRAKFPDFDYIIGDVCNQDWAGHLLARPTHVFNLAAMKHVDMGEFNVRRCVDINYGGTINTFDWALRAGAKGYVLSSTDKAVLPINAYGMSKGLAEKYLYERQMLGAPVTASVFRWGNVCGSRGSVFHAIANSLREQGVAYVTHKDMTRFWIHIKDVARFMWSRKDVATPEQPHIPKMKAASVLRLAEATAEVLGIDDYKVEYTGIRAGEKIHECLYTSHEYCLTSDKCDQFTDAELIALVREVLNDSNPRQQRRNGAQILLDHELSEDPICGS